MADIFDALLGSGVDPQQLIAGLRKQSALGQVAGLTGIAGLQKLGPQLVANAQQGAEQVSKTNASTQDRALARALGMAEYQGKLAESDQARQDRLSMNASDNATRMALARMAADRAGAKGPKLTNLDKQTIGYASRMEDAEGILKEVGTFPKGLRGAVANIAQSLPGGLGSAVTGAADQRVLGAAQRWISGILRLDSGAAVPEQEFKRYYNQYFPQPYDSPAAIADKQNARLRAVEAMKKGMAPGSALPAEEAAQTGDTPDNGADPFETQIMQLMQPGGRQ